MDNLQEMITAHEQTIPGKADGYEKVRPVAQAFLDIADVDRNGEVNRTEHAKILESTFGAAEGSA